MPRKPGYLTTEFWLTVAVNVAALVSTLAEALPPRYGAIMATIATGLYALARGWAKSQPVAVPVVTSPPAEVPTQPAPQTVTTQPPA